MSFSQERRIRCIKHLRQNNISPLAAIEKIDALVKSFGDRISLKKAEWLEAVILLLSPQSAMNLQAQDIYFIKSIPDQSNSPSLHLSFYKLFTLFERPERLKVLNAIFGNTFLNNFQKVSNQIDPDLLTEYFNDAATIVSILAPEDRLKGLMDLPHIVNNMKLRINYDEAGSFVNSKPSSIIEEKAHRLNEYLIANRIFEYLRMGANLLEMLPEKDRYPALSKHIADILIGLDEKMFDANELKTFFEKSDSSKRLQAFDIAAYAPKEKWDQLISSSETSAATSESQQLSYHERVMQQYRDRNDKYAKFEDKTNRINLDAAVRIGSQEPRGPAP